MNIFMGIGRAGIGAGIREDKRSLFFIVLLMKVAYCYYEHALLHVWV
jgi:hypothetical protein